VNKRVLIFDDHKAIRQVLWIYFDNRGYEVFTFQNPAICPLSEANPCPCPKKQSCSDIILSDIDMPLKNGLDFIEEMINKGCRCKHIALMSGGLTDEQYSKAKSLGATIFRKPFQHEELTKWVDHIEKNLDRERKLADWYLGKIQKETD
jgi:DNA-binding NtrC family response regulator